MTKRCVMRAGSLAPLGKETSSQTTPFSAPVSRLTAGASGVLMTGAIALPAKVLIFAPLAPLSTEMLFTRMFSRDVLTTWIS